MTKTVNSKKSKSAKLTSENLPNMAPQTHASSELLKRVLSALVLAPLFLYVTYIGGVFFQGMMILIFSIALWEWLKMVGTKNFVSLLSGALYIVASLFAVLMLEQNASTYLSTPPHVFPGFSVILWLCVIVWSTDCGAYIVGKLVGGAKLCPMISPNKTWAGFFGGLAAASFIGVFSANALGLHFKKMLPIFLLSLMLSLACHLGDLLQSLMKRHFEVKDMGAIIPGHGGVFDRFDSLMLAALVLAIYLNT